MNSSPNSEADRLDALRRYDLLDTAGDFILDELTFLAARLCDAPIAVIGFLDANRVRIVSRFGWRASELPRRSSFFEHAVRQTGLFVVPDAQIDKRFKTSPLVTADPNIRFFAGVPLITPDGYALGALSVIDRSPRELTQEQTQVVWALGRQILAYLETRRTIAHLQRQIAQLERKSGLFDALVEATPGLVYVYDRSGRHLYASPAAAGALGLQPGDVVGKTWQELGLSPDLVGSFDAQRVRVFETGQTLTSETTFPQPDGAGQLEYTLSPLRAADGSVEAVIALARDVTERKRLFQVLLTVREINAVIVVEKDSEQLLQQVADILLRVRHYQRVWVGLSRSGYSQLATTTDARLDVSALGEDDAYLYDLTNSVIRTGQPEVLRHAQSDSDTTRLPRGYGSVVALPIAHPGRLFGVLCAYAAAPDTFDSEEVNMLSEIAAELAAALQSIEDEKARKRAEESLHQNAKRFSALIENSTDTVALIDADSVVTYISPAVSHTLGYLPRQVIGQPLANYVHPAERQQVVDSFAEMVRHPRKVMMRRLRLRHADGSWRWIEAAVNNLLADPNVRSIVVNFRDISNRMHAEGDLRLNEARYRALVEDQPGLVCRFAPGGILTFVNEAYCRYFDKTREELVGHSFMSLIYEKDRATVERLLASLSHDNPIGVLRYRVVAAGGEVRWQQWLNRAILDSHGVVVEFQSVGHDVAQGKRRGRVPGNPQKRR